MPQVNPRYREQLRLLASNIQHDHCAEQRRISEAFIRQQFQTAYGASIQHFMPILLSLKDSDQQLLAALGLRPAANTPLFLEHYLNCPVEQALAASYNEPIDRADVVEVGHLAISEPGAARALITAMTAFLSAGKYQWVVFTIGPVLINSFIKLGLPLTDLGPANITALPEHERESWGTYYQQQPRVMAGRLADTRDFLLQCCVQEQALRKLCLQARQSARAIA